MLKGGRALSTLFCGQEPQLVRCAAVVRVALAIVSVFQNDSEPTELLHQDLYDYNDQL